MLLGKVISTISGEYRKIKARFRGEMDVRTPYQLTPAQLDSNPIADMEPVYLRTANMNDPGYIIGYRLKNPIAAVGELRLFATDADGAEQTRVWLKADGKINLGGTGASDNPNHLIQREAMKTALDNYFLALNSAIGTGVSSAGGTYAPPTTPFNMTPAKTTKLIIE